MQKQRTTYFRVGFRNGFGLAASWRNRHHVALVWNRPTNIIAIQGVIAARNFAWLRDPLNGWRCV